MVPTTTGERKMQWNGGSSSIWTKRRRLRRRKLLGKFCLLGNLNREVREASSFGDGYPPRKREFTGIPEPWIIGELASLQLRFA